jgi:hypothetical protein
MDFEYHLNIVTFVSLVMVSLFLVTSLGSNAVAQPAIGNVNNSVFLPRVPTGCEMQGEGLQDSSCTSGEPNPRASQSNIHSTICVPGWSKLERDKYAPLSYTEPLKTELMKSYGLDPADRANYELDHLIAISDGGDPRSVNNLWPQPRDKTGIQYSAEMKDGFENYLHRQVCAGHISLSDAQSELSEDWITNYQNDQQPSKFIAAMIPTNGGSNFNPFPFNPAAENMTDPDDNAR